MLTLAEVWKSNTKTTYQIHNMSKELIKLIRKNPELLDEYRMLVTARFLEHQERLAKKAAKK